MRMGDPSRPGGEREPPPGELALGPNEAAWLGAELERQELPEPNAESPTLASTMLLVAAAISAALVVAACSAACSSGVCCCGC